MQAEDDKTVCCCCCASGPIEIKISLPYTGVAVGQRLPLSCYISNLSNVNVENLKFKITKVSVY